MKIEGKKNVLSHYLLLLIPLTSYPFVFCQFLPIPNIKLLVFVFGGILSVLFALKRKVYPFSLAFNIIFYVQMVCWIFYSVYHTDTSYVTRIALMSIIYIALLNAYNTKSGLLPFVVIFNYIILAMAVAGTFCFVLVLLGKISPMFDFPNQDGRIAYFFGLTSTNAYFGNIIRYAGFFDEPGAMAYWGMWSLLFNRLFMHNPKYEKILALCLAFTFSLAYYIQLCLFIIFFAKNRMRQMLTLFVLISVSAILIYQTKNTEYDIYRFTIQRFEINKKTGKLEGDNRSNLTALAKKQFVSAPILGIGAEKMAMMEYMSDNPYEIFAKDGIVGWFVTYLPLFVLLLIGCKQKEYLYAVLILFVGYQQRPFHVDFMHPLMLYLLTVLILKRLPNHQFKKAHNRSYIE